MPAGELSVVRPHPPSAICGSVPAAWARHNLCPLVGERGPGRVVPGFGGGGQNPSHFASSSPHCWGLGGRANVSHCGLPRGSNRRCRPEHKSWQVKRHTTAALAVWCLALGAGAGRIGGVFLGSPAVKQPPGSLGCLTSQARRLLGARLRLVLCIFK